MDISGWLPPLPGPTTSDTENYLFVAERYATEPRAERRDEQSPGKCYSSAPSSAPPRPPLPTASTDTASTARSRASWRRAPGDRPSRATRCESTRSARRGRPRVTASAPAEPDAVSCAERSAGRSPAGSSCPRPPATRRQARAGARARCRASDAGRAPATQPARAGARAGCNAAARPRAGGGRARAGPRSDRAAAEPRCARPPGDSGDRRGSSRRRTSSNRSRWLAAEHAHVDLARPGRAHRADLRRLEHAQKAGLHGRRHVADLVEQQRPAVGGDEQPGARRGGARVRAALGAEQLGGQQGLAQGTAVDGDEGAIAPGARAVDCARDQLLAGAGFAADEHRRVGGSDARDDPTEAQHDRRAAHERLAARGHHVAQVRQPAADVVAFDGAPGERDVELVAGHLELARAGLEIGDHARAQQRRGQHAPDGARRGDRTPRRTDARSPADRGRWLLAVSPRA